MFTQKIIPAALLSAALSSGVIGQEAQPTEAQGEPAGAQEEVMVTEKYLASAKLNSVKTPTPILNIPQSLSITTQQEIQQQGMKSIGNIVDYTVGVNNSQGEGHRDSVVFRGIRSTADFYVDGFRDDVQYYRPLYNLEQVEILRGPNALLFGRGGTGGILNRVTKKGVLGENFVDYLSSVNTFGEYDIQIDTNAALNDRAAFRLNAYYANLDNHRDDYDGDRIGVNPTFRYDFSNDTRVDLSYEYIDHERFIDRGIPTGADGMPVERFDDIVFGDSEQNETTLEAHVFRAMLQHDFSENLKGNFNVLYGDYDKSYQNIYASGYDEVNTPNLVTLDGYIDTTERENLILSSNLVGEFKTGGIEHNVLFGGEYIDTSSDQDRFNAFWNTTNDDNVIFRVTEPLGLSGGIGTDSLGVRTTNNWSDLNDFTQVDIEVYSVYFQDQVNVTPWLQLVGGLRFDSFEIEVDDIVANASDDRTDNEWSPRGGVILKPKENISVYGSYSSSFQPRSGEQFANLRNNLAPDEFETWEGGVKWDVAPMMSFTAAYFQNEQTTSARDNVTGETFETRGMEVEGIELQFQGEIFDNLFVRTGYSWMDGETANGSEPRELPENTLFFWGNYQVSDKIGLGMGVTHQDDTLIRDGGFQKLPGYTRVDAMAYYDVTDKLRIQMNVENLTDETYFPNSHSTHQATVGQPLNARFSIIGRF